MRKIVIGAFFIFTFLFALTQIEDFDSWWHLKTGEYILTQKKIPHEDIFSFTNPPGTKWVVPGWLSGVIFYSVKQAFGFNGLIIFKALIISLAYYIILRLLLKRKNPFFLTILVLLLSVVLARFRFEVRPYIFKYLFVGLFIYLLEDYFSSGKKRNLYFLPLIMLFWVNLHGSFFLGFIILFAYILGNFLRGKFQRETISSAYPVDKLYGMRPLFFILLISVFISLINPYGYKFHQWTFKLSTLTVGTGTIPNEEFLPPRINEYTLFWVFLFITTFSLLVRRKNLNLSHLFLFLPFAFLGLGSKRYIGVFSLVNSFVLVENLNWMFGKFRLPGQGEKTHLLEKGWVRTLAQVFLFPLMVLLFLLTFHGEKSYRFGLGIRGGVYPEKAVEFIENNQIKGNLYNSEEFGGYLIWKWFPNRKIFIFNDNLLFFDLRRKVYEETKNFEDVFSKFKVAAVVRGYRGGHLENYFVRQSDWKLVWWDDTSLVYLRDCPENKDLLSRFAYQYVDPLNFDFAFAQALARHNFTESTLRELERNIEENPKNYKAHLFSAYLYENLGKKEEATSAYMKVKEIKPVISYLHYRIGLQLGKLFLKESPHLAIKELLRQRKYSRRDAELEFYLATAYYLTGSYKLAIDKFNHSLKLNPNQPIVLSNLGFLYFDLARYQEAIKAHKRVLEIEPNFADSYYGLALIYEKLAEKEESIKNWEKYLTLSKDPHWITTAKEHLEKLKK